MITPMREMAMAMVMAMVVMIVVMMAVVRQWRRISGWRCWSWR